LEGTRAVWNSLEAGGLWIVGRTNGERSNGGGDSTVSVMEKSEDGFRLVSRLSDSGNEGSEIEELALGWRCRR
jgi:hypothetical protein